MKIDAPQSFFESKLANFIHLLEECGMKPSPRGILAYDTVFILYLLQKHLLPHEIAIHERDEATMRQILLELGQGMYILPEEIQEDRKQRLWLYLEFFCAFIVQLK